MATIDYLVLGRAAGSVGPTPARHRYAPMIFGPTPALVDPGLAHLVYEDYPVDIAIAVAFGLIVPWSEVKTPCLVDLAWLDERNQPVLMEGKDHVVEAYGCNLKEPHFPFEDQRIQVCKMLPPANFPTSGWYRLHVSVNGVPQQRTVLHIGRMKDWIHGVS